MADAKALAKLREQIDAIDQQLQALIAERADLARAVGEAKGVSSTLEFFRPDREAQVLRRVAERNDGPLSNDIMLRLFREIMSACLAQQEPLKIAYLGPEGTFTQAAAYKHFGQAVRALPIASVEAVFTEVENASADFGVVPIENSIEGAVSNTLDMFIGSPLKICGEVELPIHQHLLRSSPDREGIRRVFAHQQSLAQCRAWLKENLPDAEKIAVSSNAEAARRVQTMSDAAAIASRAAADIYDLNVLNANIEDQPDNSTRFLVIGRALLPPSGDDKTSLLIAAQDEPGVLFQLLDPLAQAGISLTRIQSRPSKRGKWDYAFFIDVEGHAEEAPLKQVLQHLRPRATQLRILGSYPQDIQT